LPFGLAAAAAGLPPAAGAAALPPLAAGAATASAFFSEVAATLARLP